jgi:hypothetical protein
MIRAGVFIGVDKTGNLQKLNDAADGARRMHEWAIKQGMADRTQAKLITDAGGNRVNPDLIYDAIKELIDGPGVDQLILYFAGHGVNISRGEYWLLTDAPGNTNAAVNVQGSVELARYCGIQHVVIISDACRVAPEGIQAQSVRGSNVFPNDAASDRAKPVDQFFACLLGRTAVELKDPAIAAGNYSALYTTALLEALSGKVPDLLEPGASADDKARYVRPRKLENHLEIDVPRRVKALRLEQKVNQDPDAIITSDGSWVARIEAPLERPVGGTTRGGITRGGGPPRPSPAPENIRTVAQKLVRLAAEGDQRLLDQQLQQAKTAPDKGVGHLAGMAEIIAAPFGPDRFETECGIKVRGAHIVDLFAPRAYAEPVDSTGNSLRITVLEKPGVSLLLRFEGNRGAVIPAIPGFVAALTFDDGELVDVAYEPSVNTWRWDLFKDRAAEVRALRALAASASQHGRFRLEKEGALKVAQNMQYAKQVDPSFAIYAAYAYHDLQAIGRIREMSGYLREDIDLTLFDLALLSRELIDKQVTPDSGIVPFVPLLAQGWALLGAHRVKLHKALDGIERNMKDSLWSLFDETGLEKLKRAMQTGEVR